MRREFWAAAVSLTLAAGSVTAFALQKSDKDAKDGDKRPRLALRAQPSVGVSPARVVLTAELVGGANDFEEYYCAAVEWEWGDDTRSESTTDCEPYEEGKSEIKRRFVVEHVFARAGCLQGLHPPQTPQQAGRGRDGERPDSPGRPRIRPVDVVIRPLSQRPAHATTVTASSTNCAFRSS